MKYYELNKSLGSEMAPLFRSSSLKPENSEFVFKSGPIWTVRVVSSSTISEPCTTSCMKGDPSGGMWPLQCSYCCNLWGWSHELCVLFCHFGILILQSLYLSIKIPVQLGLLLENCLKSCWVLRGMGKRPKGRATRYRIVRPDSGCCARTGQSCDDLHVRGNW